uniref:Xyloglucan endotransglucosylase/hydrolase n=1 Tax=Kalanchoe fedtschenkoi TaxID=63787 RepID=A0A7N0TVR6_KALFE
MLLFHTKPHNSPTHKSIASLLASRMGGSHALFTALFIAGVAFHGSLVHARIDKSMYITWGAHHASISGDNLQLVLDQTSGSGARSKKTFLFGSIEMLIKLVPGNSAGTVTAYYLSSAGSAHDEIDIEFLGNISGDPYIIHTNIYTQGVGNREQQFYPWFDPTADFHNYTIHWNPTAVVWYIDSIPIRVYRNYEGNGVPYPNKQGMRVQTSLWNGEDWATRGGRVKIDWKGAPFIARLQRFRGRACGWTGAESIAQCAAPVPENWWTAPVYKQLSASQLSQMQGIRSTNMIYDYCTDSNRFNGKLPPECHLNQY